MAGSVHIAWYATGFRADKLEAALSEVTAIAPRYGATHFAVYRSRDDRYKFLQVVDFDSKIEWERYWHGDEFSAFRTTCSSWFQVPIVYVWHDVVTVSGLEHPTLEPVAE